MARTVRNPLELRTPVRTISSVMRNAPRQQFRPTQLDFGDGQSERGGRGGMGVRGGQGNLTSVTRAPRETIAGGAPVSGGVTSPVSRGTTAGAPVARVQTGTSRAPQAQAKPAVTSTIKSPAVAAKTTTPAAKPAALGALNTTKKTLTAQEIASRKATKPPTQVNVADLTPIKTPPKKVDVKTLIPVKTAQLPAGLNTKKMG